MNIVIAASGTGGHLFPALHIAKAILRISPESEIHFIGAGRPLEERIMASEKIHRYVVKSSGIQRKGLIGIVKFLIQVPAGFFHLWSLYGKIKPGVVIGVGGYASVLPIVVGRLKGIPAWSHEAERTPGLTNKFLAWWANVISLAFRDTKLAGRATLVFTGHPVREELKQVHRDVIREDAPARLLVIGGSQGARGLDKAFIELAPWLKQLKLELRHQSRPESVDEIRNAYTSAQVKSDVSAFINDMAEAYEWCDVVVSRAGASSVLEIEAVNRPAIFVPYPFQQGTHQTDNAMTLVDQGKALIVEEGDGFVDRLKGSLAEILDRNRFCEIKKKPHESRSLDAADRIAEGCLALAAHKR